MLHSGDCCLYCWQTQEGCSKASSMQDPGRRVFSRTRVWGSKTFTTTWNTRLTAKSLVKVSLEEEAQRQKEGPPCIAAQVMQLATNTLDRSLYLPTQEIHWVCVKALPLGCLVRRRLTLAYIVPQSSLSLEQLQPWFWAQYQLSTNLNSTLSSPSRILVELYNGNIGEVASSPS